MFPRPARPAAYLASLAGLFGLAFGAGALLGDPSETRAQPEHSDDGDDMAGMSSTGGDLRLVAPTSWPAGVNERFAFRIAAPDGATVRDFDVEHTKRLHLIAVRSDLTGFQHLHPEQDATGAWSTPLTLREPGAYRVFADVKPAGGEHATLSSDVLVGGEFRPRPLPASSTTTSVDGYDVALAAQHGDDGETTLTYKISQDGKPVAVEPYLGADGHLVALRAGDLAYLHVHPLDRSRPGEIAFGAHYPSAGRYRLFLQFKAAGRVHTAALTQEAAAA